jgi:cytochrome c oxidase subunit 4
MATSEAAQVQEHPHERQYPTEGTYFAVFVALAILTVIELAVVYLPGIRVPLLVGLAFSKAWLVVQFYMHLRYDNKLFSWVFLLPLAAGAILTVALQPLVQ